MSKRRNSSHTLLGKSGEPHPTPATHPLCESLESSLHILMQRYAWPSYKHSMGGVKECHYDNCYYMPSLECVPNHWLIAEHDNAMHKWNPIRDPVTTQATNQIEEWYRAAVLIILTMLYPAHFALCPCGRRVRKEKSGMLWHTFSISALVFLPGTSSEPFAVLEPWQVNEYFCWA